jgi:hypothetical protein
MQLAKQYNFLDFLKVLLGMAPCTVSSHALHSPFPKTQRLLVYEMWYFI